MFSFYSNSRSVISKGVSESRVFRVPFTPAFGENGQISGRVALRDLLFTLPKHKVPRPYSGALPIYAQKRRANGSPTGAPSLTGARDDDFIMRISHRLMLLFGFYHYRAS